MILDDDDDDDEDEDDDDDDDYLFWGRGEQQDPFECIQ